MTNAHPTQSPHPTFGVAKLASCAALALCVGLLTPSTANAQHHGGGGGGGGYHGGGGGGGYHGGGGGWHGGGGHGWGGHGWGGGGWGGRGWGGRGWGGWGGGYYGGIYPTFGFGFSDPFWYDDWYAPSYYGPSAVYPAAPPVYSGPAPAYGPDPAYGPSYGQQGPQYYAPVTPGSGGVPNDNSRGFYTWPVGVESGTCNRSYVAQIATNLTGPSTVSLRSGATLGGISVGQVVGGRIGPRFDVTDQACVLQSLEHAKTGAVVSWQTSAGIPVTFQATRSYVLEGGQHCREVEITAAFASHRDTVRGTSCRVDATGGWQQIR